GPEKARPATASASARVGAAAPARVQRNETAPSHESTSPGPALISDETLADTVAGGNPGINPPVIPESSGTPGAESADLERLWTQLLEAVGRASAFTRSYLIEAHPVSVTKSLLTIGFDPDFADH